MQPKIELVSTEIIGKILTEAYQLLMTVGVKVLVPEARELLAAAGADVDTETCVVRIPEVVARKALETVPNEFWLYNRLGEPTIHYGGDSVHFDPGSSALNMLNAETLEHYATKTADLVNLIKLVEMLPQYDAQSTAIVCNEVPTEIGDLYRLYLILLHSTKPIVTGAFSARTTQVMVDMLAIFAGGRKALAEKPQAVFDVCSTPPLIWTEFGAQNLIDLARAGVPAEIISMPIAGVAAPVTMLGSVVQHTAECMSGITIHQLAKAGSPVVWGGAPTIMDMRQGTTPMGAIETGMIDSVYAQVGKSLGLPTHTYLGATDAKIVDAQAGLESGMSMMMGALSGINMISGAGMLDFLASQSLEKLVIDAEAIGMVKRLIKGVIVHTDPLALGMYEGIDFKGDFLKQKTTRKLVRKEQYIPSEVIDRGSLRTWQDNGRLDMFDRAKIRTQKLLDSYQRPELPEDKIQELRAMVQKLAANAGMESLPAIE